MSDLSLFAGLLLVSALAIGYDVRERRIPNLVTAGGLLLALVLRGLGGWDPIAEGAAAAGIGLGLSLPLFALGALGGGDAKLLTTVAAYLGLERLFTAILAIALIGGVLSLVSITRAGAWSRTLSQLGRMWRSLRWGTASTNIGSGPPGPAESGARSLTVPYAIAIGLGGLVGWWL